MSKIQVVEERHPSGNASKTTYGIERLDQFGEWQCVLTLTAEEMHTLRDEFDYMSRVQRGPSRAPMGARTEKARD